jgi:hypothetical protein
MKCRFPQLNLRFETHSNREFISYWFKVGLLLVHPLSRVVPLATLHTLAKPHRNEMTVFPASRQNGHPLIASKDSVMSISEAWSPLPLTSGLCQFRQASSPVDVRRPYQPEVCRKENPV